VPPIPFGGAAGLGALIDTVCLQNHGQRFGWVQEIPGVNCQGKTRAELLKNLRSVLKEALEFNREDAIAAAQEG
jgi:predicted RNase H-like HicB family nuclease